jgi:hypothetical protein
MIPYEDLERALTRWKARKAGAVESPAPPPEGDETPAAPVVLAEMSVSEVSVEVRDHTGELDLTDAEVDES